MNICLTNRCNHKCEYCQWRNWFIKDDVATQDMGIDFVKKIIDFRFGGSNHVLTGGEPLLHPQIDQILDVFKQTNNFCILRTNLEVERSLVKYLTDKYRDIIESWEINLDYCSNDGTLFYDNFFDCIFNKSNFIMYITMCPDRQKIDVAFSKIDDFYARFEGNVPCVYLYFKAPIVNEKFVIYDYTSDLERNILSLYQKHGKLDLKIKHSMTGCEIDRKYLEQKLAHTESLHFDETAHSVFCHQKPYIMPDETIILCPSCPRVSVKDFEKIYDELIDSVKLFFDGYIYDDFCRSCSSFNPGVCTSWCPVKREHLTFDK